ncbi:MAG TPA: tRNA lysidine(34) synthetase TilS [Allosphingosinicella sp.]|nr:tRNA lysidine(34) synthetase TilS [Allosphingosinicella sp.]
MNGRLPDPDAVARFRADLEALTGAAPGPLGIAVSGGPDSLALLLLAWAAFPDRVSAATVDHRLRPESAGEAAFVHKVCAGLGVPHVVLAADEAIAGNVQAAARALRYRLLADWAAAGGIGWLLTGHHRDDQAETLLMRLQRGAGLAGLAGIRPCTEIDGLKVARPLLGWPRAELALLVEAAGLEAVRDPSNEDERYDRARLRRRLGETDWIDPEPLARSAEALAEADAALEWSVERLIAERVEAARGGLAFDPEGVPAELRRRALLRLLALLVPADPPRGDAVQRLLAALDAGETATLAGVKCEGGPVWRLTPAPPRRGA